MLTKKSPKNPLKFECKKCTYVTSNKKDYNKHLTTAKHKKLIMLTEKIPKIPNTFICELCDKQYKSRTGLWLHQKKCASKQDYVDDDQEEPSQETSE